MKRALSFVVLLLAVNTSLGQSQVVTPSVLNGVEGSNMYIYGGPITFQQVMAPSQLGGLSPGAIITGMRLRLDSHWFSSPASTVSHFDVSLGSSNFAPGSLTSSVTANQGAGTVSVRSGSLTFADGAFTFGGSPNEFGPLIQFTTPYTYTGGNLLLTVAHTTPSSELDFDVVEGNSDVQTAQSQVYGTDFLSDNSPNSALGVQFEFTAVPEPASIAVAATMILSGLLVYRRYGNKKQVLEQVA